MSNKYKYNKYNQKISNLLYQNGGMSDSYINIHRSQIFAELGVSVGNINMIGDIENNTIVGDTNLNNQQFYQSSHTMMTQDSNVDFKLAPLTQLNGRFIDENKPLLYKDFFILMMMHAFVDTHANNLSKIKKMLELVDNIYIFDFMNVAYIVRDHINITYIKNIDLNMSKVEFFNKIIEYANQNRNNLFIICGKHMNDYQNTDDMYNIYYTLKQNHIYDNILTVSIGAVGNGNNNYDANSYAGGDDDLMFWLSAICINNFVQRSIAKPPIFLVTNDMQKLNDSNGNKNLYTESLNISHIQLLKINGMQYNGVAELCNRILNFIKTSNPEESKPINFYGDEHGVLSLPRCLNNGSQPPQFIINRPTISNVINELQYKNSENYNKEIEAMKQTLSMLTEEYEKSFGEGTEYNKKHKEYLELRGVRQIKADISGMRRNHTKLRNIYMKLTEDKSPKNITEAGQKKKELLRLQKEISELTNSIAIYSNLDDSKLGEAIGNLFREITLMNQNKLRHKSKIKDLKMTISNALNPPCNNFKKFMVLIKYLQKTYFGNENSLNKPIIVKFIESGTLS